MKPKERARRTKRHQPVASAVAVSALSVLTVEERTPELREQIAGATLQAPARRDEVMDEAHNELATGGGAVGRGVQQAPPSAGMPLPPRSVAQQFWDAYDESAGWWATQQSIMNTRRAAFLLVLQPMPDQDESHAKTDVARASAGQGVQQAPPAAMPPGRGLVDDGAAISRRAPPLDWQQPRNAVLLDLPAVAVKPSGDAS